MLKISTWLILFLLSFISMAQDDYSEEYLEEDNARDSSYFFIGFNLNAHFANKNTAYIYNGSPNVTPFGIPYIMNLPNNQAFFNNYFKNHPYQIDEYPFNPTYRTAIEIGLHLGYQFNRYFAIFADINTTSLRYEQLFTIAVDDPNNGIVGPTYFRFPIFGRESRFNANLGTEISISSFENSNFYLPLYFNFNAVQMEENYFVVDTREFQIFHPNNNNQNGGKLGGTGYGAGTGLGFKINLTETIKADINYHLNYTKINIDENLQPYGFFHTVGIRGIWIK